PFFDGNTCCHWKAKMTIFIQSLDYNLWDLIVDGPNLPTVTLENGDVVPKPRNLYDDNDRRRVQVNAKAKHIIICAINSNDFSRISSISAKEMWDRLEVTYKGANQVKEAKISMLVHDYEIFTMNDIKSMFSRFTNIINALQALDKTYSNSEMMRKILRCLPSKKKFGGKSNKKIYQKRESSKLEEIICFECNKPGHYKSDCP
ncbi:LOW QUALITY PROTEIN: zf-CCHC domain-containing protein/UBN2 domain-containing protein, partial [Cephalotus follicularis]